MPAASLKPAVKLINLASTSNAFCASSSQALTGGLDGVDEVLRLLFVESFLQGFHVVVHGDPSFGSQHTYHNSDRKAIIFSRIIFIYSGAFLQMFL